MKRRIAIAGASVVLGGCAAIDLPIHAPPALLINGSGQAIGTAAPAQTSGGVAVTISASGLPHGLHAIHVHEFGRCDPPSFESAGSHLNPENRRHGFNNPQGPHAGDLPNVAVSSSGVLRETVVIAATSLAGLTDSDGSALILHANPDDYITEPNGNSGARIACAVLAPAR